MAISMSKGEMTALEFRNNFEFVGKTDRRSGFEDFLSCGSKKTNVGITGEDSLTDTAVIPITTFHTQWYAYTSVSNFLLSLPEIITFTMPQMSYGSLYLGNTTKVPVGMVTFSPKIQNLMKKNSLMDSLYSELKSKLLEIENNIPGLQDPNITIFLEDDIEISNWKKTVVLIKTCKLTFDEELIIFRMVDGPIKEIIDEFRQKFSDKKSLNKLSLFYKNLYIKLEN